MTSDSSNITPPRVPFLDPATGLISRPWFMWLLNMFARANGTDVDVAALTSEVEYLASAPAPYVAPAPPDDLAPVPVAFPVSNNLIASAVALSNTTQVLTNAEQTIGFDGMRAGSFGITLASDEFTATVAGIFTFMLQAQIYQLVADNITSIWVMLNGTPVTSTAGAYITADVDDTNILCRTISLILEVGDVVAFHIITDLVTGSQLQYFPASVPLPAFPSVQVTILGFRP